MSSEREQWAKEWTKDRNRRVKIEQRRLRALADDKLMALHLSLLPSKLDEKRAPEENITFEALCHEVRRRTIAAGWLWNRWRNPGEYEKWLIHTSNTEARLGEVMGEWVRERDPDAAETERREAGRRRDQPRLIDLMDE